jgi:transposase-like protein
VVATGVCGDGRREVLGFAVGDSEDGAFWTGFLRSLKARGLQGVQLVIADAHLGLRQAVAAVMAGAAMQRCRVHYADGWVMPMWLVDPLRCSGFGLVRSA